MRKGQVKGRGLALPWAAGLVSFSGRGGGASASAVIAGLVDILTSADAVGHAANTVGRVASYPYLTLFRQPFQGWCMVRLRQNRRMRWMCSPIWSVFEGAAVGREEDTST